jgi:trk system potassium uptake protein
MAHLILEEMSLGEMMMLLKLRKGQFSLVAEQLEASSKAVGKTVGELALPHDCVLTAIVRGGQLVLPKSRDFSKSRMRSIFLKTRTSQFCVSDKGS